MKRFCMALLILGLLGFVLLSQAIDEKVHTSVPFPHKSIRAEAFFIADDGSLSYSLADKTYSFQQDKWLLGRKLPATTLYSVEGSSMNLKVLKDGVPIYVDTMLNAIVPLDDKIAYGTKENKVYRVDMQTGRHRVICYVEGWGNADWPERILLSDNILYIIQTKNSFIQAIDLDTAEQIGIATLNIALASNMDIGNFVLESTENKFTVMHPGVLINAVKTSQDQFRLDMMTDPGLYDLVICEPSLWNDLAKAEVLEDLESHEKLKEAWLLWTDMNNLCRFHGALLCVPIWDNVPMLGANNLLLPVLKDVSWPEPGWTWNEFLDFARKCKRDLNGDGQNDVFIAYQRMFYPSWQKTWNYSLPVNQAALLYLNRKIPSLGIPEVVDMLEVWKTLYDEKLLYPADGSYEEPNSNQVVFAFESPAEWAMYMDFPDIRLSMPGLSDELFCQPAESVLMSINKHSRQLELAVDYMNIYMRYGADDHNYLKERVYSPQNLFPYQKVWGPPSEFHERHYDAGMKNAFREPWERSLYEDMELQLLRYLEGQISVDECVKLWEEKLRMTQME